MTSMTRGRRHHQPRLQLHPCEMTKTGLRDLATVKERLLRCEQEDMGLET